jgi:uncharacterized protein YndB with AHSA1/START domain
MFTVERSARIARPPSEVFAYVADPRNDPAWRSAVRDVRLPPGPLAAGARYELVEEVPPMGRKVYEQEVREYVPGRRFVVATVAGPLLHPTQRYTFEPEGEGATRLRVEMEVRGVGAFRLLEPLLRGPVRQRVEEYLEKLRGVLEKGGEGSGAGRAA